jgi:hypothetical protein
MDVLKVLRKEESKLLTVFGKVESELSRVRAAINAMSSNGSKSYHAKASKLRGRKLSAAHRRAIKLGIAKRKKAQATAKA